MDLSPFHLGVLDPTVVSSPAPHHRSDLENPNPMEHSVHHPSGHAPVPSSSSATLLVAVMDPSIPLRREGHASFAFEDLSLSLPPLEPTTVVLKDHVATFDRAREDRPFHLPWFPKEIEERGARSRSTSPDFETVGRRSRSTDRGLERKGTRSRCQSGDIDGAGEGIDEGVVAGGCAGVASGHVWHVCAWMAWRCPCIVWRDTAGWEANPRVGKGTKGTMHATHVPKPSKNRRTGVEKETTTRTKGREGTRRRRPTTHPCVVGRPIEAWRRLG